MKRLIALIIILILGVSVILMFKEDVLPSEPPEVLIKAGDVEIDYYMAKNSWNGTEYDRVSSFPFLMADKTLTDYAYVLMGETITIEIFDDQPDHVALHDVIVNENGTMKYSIKENIIPIEFNSNTGSFTLEFNPAALLSSNYDDYRPGMTIRGFELTCEWQDGSSSYSFVIRTDAYDDF